MNYKIHDKLKLKDLFSFSLQVMLACFTATVLIANICGVNVPAALVGAGLSTIAYAIITRFDSPMMISNSGAYVAPVLAALGMAGYTGIMIGGIVSFIVYGIMGIIFSKINVNNIYKIFPKVLIGSITVVIGVNLMSFIPSYIGGTTPGIIVAIFTMVCIALASHYLKGTLSLFPFLIGTIAGYLLSIPFGLVDFSVFKNISFIQVPDFAFMNFTPINWNTVIPIVILFIAFTLSACMEALADHAALGNIVGTDLYKKPGLNKIFIGEGVANLVGSFFGGLGQCSYGEGIGVVGFSKCASIYSIIGAAILMIILGFIGPINAFIASIPSAVIGGGTAMILYGFIANSGIKMLKQVDFNNQKNLIISSVAMSIGISGIAIGGDNFALSGTALALIVGIILNLILKEKPRYEDYSKFKNGF